MWPCDNLLSAHNCSKAVHLPTYRYFSATWNPPLPLGILIQIIGLTLHWKFGFSFLYCRRIASLNSSYLLPVLIKVLDIYFVLFYFYYTMHWSFGSVKSLLSQVIKLRAINWGYSATEGSSEAPTLYPADDGYYYSDYGLGMVC